MLSPLLSPSYNNQVGVIEAFSSRYLDDLLNVENPYFITNGK